MLIAYDWWRPSEFPFLNEAFLFSFVLSTVLAIAGDPVRQAPSEGHAGHVGRGDARRGLRLRHDVPRVRHRARTMDRPLRRRPRLVDEELHHLRPGRHPEAARRSAATFPFTLPYEAVRDIVVVLIHVVFFGLIIFLWRWWQKRGDAKPSTEIATSTYGRPLVKKA